jgi:hypothetical protein
VFEYRRRLINFLFAEFRLNFFSTHNGKCVNLGDIVTISLVHILSRSRGSS